MRKWTCENGHQLDYIYNASINILGERLKIISAGTIDYTGGDLKNTFLPEAQVLETRGPFVFSKWVVLDFRSVLKIHLEPHNYLSSFAVNFYFTSLTCEVFSGAHFKKS